MYKILQNNNISFSYNYQQPRINNIGYAKRNWWNFQITVTRKQNSFLEEEIQNILKILNISSYEIKYKNKNSFQYEAIYDSEDFYKIEKIINQIKQYIE